MNSKYIYTSYMKKLSPTEEFDTEKFILEVQKRECIWNVNSKSYNLKCIRNRETKKQAWDEIARVFHGNWDEFTAEEKQKKVEALSRKWANIRKYYTDEIRKPANSPPKKRQRRYHHLLTFLDESAYKRRISRIKEFKSIGKQKTGPNYSSSDSETGELFIVEDADELQNLSAKSDGPTVATAPLDNKEKNSNAQSDEKREAGTTFHLWDNSATLTKNNNDIKSSNPQIVEKNPEILKLLNESRGPPPFANNFMYVPSAKPIENSVLPPKLTLDQTAEASKRFLLSLLPEIMSLNVKQNLQFRLGIMDLLNDIKLRVTPSVNNMPFPNLNFS